MIFSEKNKAWQIFDVFVNVICAVSSYFYLFYASSRNAVPDEEFANNHYVLSWFFESVFFIYMCLNFFKEYTPEGGGDLQEPIREWSKII